MIDDFRRPPKKTPTKLDTMAAGGTTPDPISISPIGPDSDTGAPTSTNTGEPAFTPPDQVAATTPSKANPYEFSADELLAASKKRWWSKFDLRHLSRRQGIILSCIVLCLAAGGGAFVLSYHKPKAVEQKVVAVPPKTPAPTPKPITSPLSGMPTTLDKTLLPVTGVMIENSADARPQSGLDQAGVVFEAIAEAGITRFLALYQETDPAVLGPVRSARPYFVEWAYTFDAGYAHVGGSPDGLKRIKELGVRDMDQFYNAGAYHRISSRYAPHNMYTSMDSLRGLEQAKGYNSSTFTPFLRKPKEEPSKAPTAKSIDFSISSSYYSVHYDYDPASNSYKRSEGGEPHIDNETKQQLSPKVVIALAMPYSLMSDGYHSMYNSIGSGQMLLFQDGTVTPGTWSKADAKSQFVFKDDSGKDLLLNPGQTWISVLSDIGKASYKP